MPALIRPIRGAVVWKRVRGTEVSHEVELPGHAHGTRVESNRRSADYKWPISEDGWKQSDQRPVRFAHKAGRYYWLYQRLAYVSEDELLTEADVLALINEAANKRRLALEKAHALQSMTEHLDNRGKRERIPQDVKVIVWQRDGGRCVDCGSQTDLEFDHIIPLALGGSNTVRNLQLLCASCNRRKGATLG